MLIQISEECSWKQTYSINKGKKEMNKFEQIVFTFICLFTFMFIFFIICFFLQFKWILYMTNLDIVT